MAGACDSVVKLLSPYVDDALGGPDRAAVASHLRSCVHCAARLSDLEATRGALGAYFAAQADAVDFTGFGAKVMAQIRKEPLGLMQRLRLGWAELTAYHAGAIYSALGAAAIAAAAVAVVMGRPAAPNNQLVVHGMSVSDPRYQSVVMHTDDGESVIMLVQHPGDAPDASSPSSPSAQPVSNPEPPHGGNL